MLAYLIGCFALIIKPGPDLMCTIATALSEGRARAFTLMFGLIAGVKRVSNCKFHAKFSGIV